MSNKKATTSTDIEYQIGLKLTSHITHNGSDLKQIAKIIPCKFKCGQTPFDRDSGGRLRERTSGYL